MLAQIHNYEKVVGTEYNDYVYKETVNLGDQKLAFSPDVIANNIFTFMYKGFKASVQSQYVSEQNMTNTGFKSYVTTDDNGNDVNVGTTIGSHFTTNIDLSYNFSIKKLGLKDATIGFTMYNLFSKEYDNNGWAAPHYNKDANGNVFAYSHKDQYSAGFAPSAPFNCMAHLSLNF
jgi:iron complex outermembrane receptor protein